MDLLYHLSLTFYGIAQAITGAVPASNFSRIRSKLATNVLNLSSSMHCCVCNSC
ncbi:hypothetical protein THIOM_002786 [Candidatus Thiomargarita nelsonii]|uniref:Uncharacterized protein n=1 Tax=Candidatus Thiomargarita nelsonii TaxID=1003181 RepID=A0A176S0D0_9GAMM|nr:hypothetical protein THIOM_002786 [Candidatus Thiomargarita nelsonii]